MPRGGRLSGQRGNGRVWTSREIRAARNENTGSRAEREAFIRGRAIRADLESRANRQRGRG